MLRRSVGHDEAGSSFSQFCGKLLKMAHGKDEAEHH
jgi:hypothetical protein